MAERVVVVLANGELPEAEAVRERLRARRPDRVIAADGGARHAAALGLTIDKLVGDLDSIPPDLRADLAARHVEFRQRPADKDETDLELALLDAGSEEAAQVVVLGATGGRLDMTLANLQLLLHPSLQAADFQFWVGRQTAYRLLPPGGQILGAVGDTVSLMPFGGPAQDVTTFGLVFPLRAETLIVGPARGVSNRVAQPKPRVTFRAGALLVVHTPQAGA
jgi:thiamine pyrophosphokinase